MRTAHRPFALVVIAATLVFAAGCGGNKSKLVGKWKVDSASGKDAEGVKFLEAMKLIVYLDFGSDDTVKIGVDSTDPKMKEELAKQKDKAAGFASGKYKISGDVLEFVDMKEQDGKGSPLGKDNKAKMKFEGDTLTLTGSDATLKLSKMK